MSSEAILLGLIRIQGFNKIKSVLTLNLILNAAMKTTINSIWDQHIEPNQIESTNSTPNG